MSSIWNLLPVTLLAPRIWGWLLDLLKICVPLAYNIWMNENQTKYKKKQFNLKDSLLLISTSDIWNDNYKNYQKCASIKPNYTAQSFICCVLCVVVMVSDEIKAPTRMPHYTVACTCTSEHKLPVTSPPKNQNTTYTALKKNLDAIIPPRLNIKWNLTQ
jgi:hypothetical protein